MAQQFDRKSTAKQEVMNSGREGSCSAPFPRGHAYPHLLCTYAPLASTRGIRPYFRGHMPMVCRLRWAGACHELASVVELRCVRQSLARIRRGQTRRIDERLPRARVGVGHVAMRRGVVAAVAQRYNLSCFRGTHPIQRKPTWRTWEPADAR